MLKKLIGLKISPDENFAKNVLIPMNLEYMTLMMLNEIVEDKVSAI
jgi:hypothetical protein